MELLRTHIGLALRDARLKQDRTLRDVAASAKVSLGYLSEIERGQKEPSSELLNAIAGALNLTLSEVMVGVSRSIATSEAPALAVVDTNAA
jgi:transcriptional regulator with XRE-family HTH domain